MTPLIDALATFRLTRLIQADAFPPIVHVKKSMREHLFIPGSPSVEYFDELAYNCPWCLSFWVAAIVVTARRFVPRLWDPVARALAFSAVSGVITERV